MAVGWSRPRDDEPGHPDHADKPTVIAFDFDPATGLATARIARGPVSHPAPDDVQDDVIEPTAVFKPWLPSTDWDNVEITVEYYD